MNNNLSYQPNNKPFLVMAILFALSLLMVFCANGQSRMYGFAKEHKFDNVKAHKDSLKTVKGNGRMRVTINGKNKDLLLVSTGSEHGKHFRGAVDGDSTSLVAVSVYGDELMGLVVAKEGNYSVGWKNGKVALYNHAALPKLTDTCFTADHNYEPDAEPSMELSNKLIKVYLECDYAFYQAKGSSEVNVKNYVAGLFNQVATLYQNEGINIAVSEIKVWTQPDPYASATSTSAALGLFRNYVNTNYPNHSGNLAHLLTTRSLGGGIAYVDVLCYKPYAFGVSMVYNTYNTVPTYSWSVECVTHELGHNLGSPHTQSCSWTLPNGTKGTLDDCYTPEGGCTPTVVQRSTVMSYCHLTSYGINFQYGFGQQPGDLLRNRVANATCLTTTTVCNAPVNLLSSNVTSSTATLKWSKPTNAASYTLEAWFYLNGAKVIQTATKTDTFTNSTNLNPNTKYTWRVKADCSAWSDTAYFTTLPATPTACATATGLAANNVTSTSASLSWAPVAGATSYAIKLRLGSAVYNYTSSSTTINVSGLIRRTQYYFSVKANCATAYSSELPFKTKPR